MADGVGESPKASDNPNRIVIKKYANRRLYNTASSTYVTLEHLAELVRTGADFVVFDAKSGDDITRQVLTQIIFDEETRGQNLLPIQFLRQLIKMYGDQMQVMMAPAFLEASLDAFSKQQEAFREQWAGFAAGGKAGANPFEEQIRANMAMFDSAMKMWSPFAGAAAPSPAPAAKPAEEKPAAADDELSQMRRRMEEMQAQIERLAKR